MNLNPFKSKRKNTDNMLGIGDIVTFTFRKGKNLTGEIVDYSYATKLYTIKTSNVVEYKLSRGEIKPE